MRWEKVKVTGGEGPGKRWGHTCNAVRDGRLLYLFGGYGKFNCQTNQVHVFDTLRRIWSEPAVKGTPPSPRDSHSCSVVGDNLFVFGGTDGTRLLNDLHILDTASHTWIFPTVRGEAPDAREGHASAVIGKRLFVFGGCGRYSNNTDDVYYNDLYILNTETYMWMRAITSGTPPSPRDSHTCSSWKNKLIVAGGEDEQDYYLSDVHVLDTDTLIWSKVCTSSQSLPPRAGHCTVSFGKYLFVFGGFTEAQSLYNDLYMLDIETGVWTKVATTPNGPSARFSVAGDCLDPHMSGVLVLLGGCNRNLEALDDMYYLYTGIARERDPRLDKLSLRKQLKLKCQGQNLNLVQNPILCGYGVNADGKLNTPVRQPMHLGQRVFHAKVTEKNSTGYTIETVIDGKHLRGILFSNKPNILSSVANTSNRKRTASEIETVAASDDILMQSNNVTTSTVLRQDKREDQQELRTESLEFLERHNEADTIAVSSIPTTAAESFKVSVDPEPEASSLNLNSDEKKDSGEKNDAPKSLIESLENDGSNDVTSSKGEIQIGDQINVPFFNCEISRQTSDAPNCDANILEPAAAESSVSPPNQGITVDCATPRTEGQSEEAKLT
ncbi:hypothetical protein PHAVU_009G202800 [Phaseolus vulgaris]|uniref:Uncharacterized protein n=1 Tax=Phaseolus vulgaris TaxID=3885 RepID=V7AXR5_PHAVU|nr:hypothetical protein PHAVU_009G202800g [Phaseolus vulgaris]ESW10364.1 hypothetical protein PHAVU_009G202800g [Phaseolus vulgaris]